jgi:uncharacterized protein YrrD
MGQRLDLLLRVGADMSAEEEERHYIEGYNVAMGFFADELAAQRAENSLLKNRVDRLLAAIRVAKDLIGEDKDNAAFAVLCGAGEET